MNNLNSYNGIKLTCNRDKRTQQQTSNKSNIMNK